MRYLLATSNRHKAGEVAAILHECGGGDIELRTLADYPHVPPIREDGTTFAENARIKALAASEATGEPTVADDSGLVVDALGGEPGIHSARYAGEHATDADRIAKVLDAMRDAPWERRTARFICALALARNGKIAAEVEGRCEGFIAFEPRGADGFGYDPIFFLPEYGKTIAELGAAVKNRISHRARALRALVEFLR